MICYYENEEWEREENKNTHAFGTMEVEKKNFYKIDDSYNRNDNFSNTTKKKNKKKFSIYNIACKANDAYYVVSFFFFC